MRAYAIIWRTNVSIRPGDRSYGYLPLAGLLVLILSKGGLIRIELRANQIFAMGLLSFNWPDNRDPQALSNFF